MSEFKQMVGYICNALTVFAFDRFDERGQAKWLCKCSCGQIISVNGNKLRRGVQKSCGCLKKPRREMANLVFNNIRVIRFDHVDHNRQARWWCECLRCGKIFSTLGNSVARGLQKSCGCLKKQDNLGLKRFMGGRPTHGQSSPSTPAYRSWASMILRCSNPKATGYKNYGGRGISVCDRWLKFENFFEDMGPRPDDTSLDRFPNTGGNYEPGNCRWATRKQQRETQRKSMK